MVRATGRPPVHIKYVALLMGILALALLLRVWGLGAKSLWLDEIMTVQKASKPFSGMMKEILGHDAHPPLFQIVEWAWLRFGSGDGYARVPSVIAGVIGVWLSALIARRLFGRRAGLAAGLLMAISYFHIFYSQEARLHALMTTLFLGQAYLLLRIIACRGRAGWGLWTAYGVLGLLSLYTYALCILTIGALALAYLVLMRRRIRWTAFGIEAALGAAGLAAGALCLYAFRAWHAAGSPVALVLAIIAIAGPAFFLALLLRRRSTTCKLVAVHLLIGLVFMPWVPVMQERTAVLARSLEMKGDAVPPPTLVEMTSGIASWGVGLAPWERMGMPVGAVLGLAFLGAAAVCLWERRGRRAAILLAILFLVPLIGYRLLPMPRVHVYEPKHIMFLQPVLLIALCGARRRHLSAEERRLPPVVYVLLALGILNGAGLLRYYQPQFEKENWRGLAAELAPKVESRDVIVFNPTYTVFAFMYYASVDAPKVPIEDVVRPGAQASEDVRRIWLVHAVSPVERSSVDGEAALQERGWYKHEEHRYHGALGYVEWGLFTREPPPPKDVPAETKP